MNTKPVLGEMKIVDMGGSIVVLFDNLAQGKVSKSWVKGLPKNTTDDRLFVGYTRAALHGEGRNHLRTGHMHENDQRKIAEARTLV